MIQSPASPPLTGAPSETPSDLLRLSTCPLCHAPHAALTPDAIAAGDSWRCVRCGQQWDARRLDSVAAYAAWVTAHDRVV